MNTTRRGFFSVVGGGLLAALGFKRKPRPMFVDRMFDAAYPDCENLEAWAARTAPRGSIH